jgi:signal transduction histidine kinase
VVAGVAVLTAGWHLGLWRLGINEQRTELVLVYLTGLFTLWFVLAGIHPAYFSLLLVMYPQIFRHLRLTLAVPAAVALTVEVVWREVLASGQPLSENPPAIAGGLVSVVFGSLFAFWLTRIIDQSHERRRLIEQLEATRSELDAAEREGGRLAERQRLARDIHDTLAQGSSPSSSSSRRPRPTCPTTRWSGTGCGACWPARTASRWWARPPRGPRRWPSATGSGPMWS